MQLATSFSSPGGSVATCDTTAIASRCSPWNSLITEMSTLGVHTTAHAQKCDVCMIGVLFYRCSTERDRENGRESDN